VPRREGAGKRKSHKNFVFKNEEREVAMRPRGRREGGGLSQGGRGAIWKVPTQQPSHRDEASAY
jgi:hypothetical protein